jgi:pimeloyl-ACP methyl ester carboxylesterase/DNA-binding CsgD family transcriptional regulator
VRNTAGSIDGYAVQVRRDISYARSGGLRIAYQVLGEGPPDLVFMPGYVSHLDLAWEEPHLARFLRGLASFSRLIWFDKRGTGLSDRIPGEPPVEDRIDDIRAVMDAAGSARAALLGVSDGAALCTAFGHRYPERVSSMVLFAGFARGLRGDDYPWGWSREFFESYLAGLDRSWSTGYGIERACPSVAGDERYYAWFARYLRAAASPGAVRDLMRANATLDLRPILADIAIPTLLLHRAHDPWVPIDLSRYLVQHLPNARLVELSGVDHWPWLGDAEAVLMEIEAFLTRRQRSRRDRPAWGPEALTRRERDVAGLAVQGLSNREIAERLFISERTAETHVANAYLKLGVNSRLDLVRRAAEFDL